MINTTLCYIERDDKYLMLYRNKKENDLNEGKWVGVGGKFEPGETPEDCLKREVKEETGLTLNTWRFLGVIRFLSDKWEDENMFLYIGYDYEGELINCSEGELAWVEKSKVLDLPIWEGDKYFLKDMIDGKTAISMTLRYEDDKLVEVL